MYGAAKNISPKDSSKLFIFVDEIDRAIKWNDINSWRAADKGFNHLLELSTKNRRLADIERRLDDQMYPLMTTYLSVPSTDKRIFSVYNEIAGEVSSGNSEIAKEKATLFVRDLKSNLQSFLVEVVIPLIGSSNK